jgi:hypothetical protein
VRRSYRQAVKHEAALAEAGVKNLATGAPLKESIVITVKGAKEPGEVLKVLQLARQEATRMGKKLGQEIKVGVLGVKEARAAVDAQKAAADKAVQSGDKALESGGEKALEQGGERALDHGGERLLERGGEHLALEGAAKIGGKLLKAVPFVGIIVGGVFVAQDAEAGEPVRAAWDAAEAVPVVGDVVMGADLAVNGIPWLFGEMYEQGRQKEVDHFMKSNDVDPEDAATAWKGMQDTQDAFDSGRF